MHCTHTHIHGRISVEGSTREAGLLLLTLVHEASGQRCREYVHLDDAGWETGAYQAIVLGAQKVPECQPELDSRPFMFRVHLWHRDRSLFLTRDFLYMDKCVGQFGS